MTRRIAKLAGRLVLALIALAGVGFAGLQTGPGRSWLASRLGAALSDADTRVSVTGIEGLVPFDLRIASITLADKDGSFLTVEHARIDVSAGALLRGHAVLRRVAAQRIAVARPSHAGGGGGIDPRKLLHPPLPVAVEALEIGTVALAAPVLGTPMTLTLKASGAVGAGTADLDLDLERSDGTPGAAIIHLALGGEPLRLALDATAREPTGDVLAALLSHDKPLPLALTIKGEGPLDAWNGTLSLAAGTEASAEARLAVTGDAPRRVSLTGDARMASLLPPQWRKLAEGGVRIAAALSLGGDTIALDDLTVGTGAATLAAQGRYDAAKDTLDGSAHLAIADLGPPAAALGLEIGGGGTLDLALAGKLARPSADVSLRLDRLSAPQGRVDHASATVALRPSGALFGAPLGITASGVLTGIAPATVALRGGLGQRLDWSLAGTIDPAGRSLALDRFALSNAGATLDGTARASGDGAAGTIRLALPDLAAFDDGALGGALDLTAEFRAARDGSVNATVSGGLAGPRTGMARADAVLGARIGVSATLRRGADGTFEAKDVSLDAASLQLSGAGSRTADDRVVADIAARLRALGTLDPRLAGDAIAAAHVEGPADALQATVTVEGQGLAASSIPIEGFSARLAVPRVAAASGRLDAKARVRGIDIALSADGAMAQDQLRIGKLVATGGGARIEGDATLGGGTIAGKLQGRVPDLRPFGAIAGTPMSGSATFDVQAKGQRYTAKAQATAVAAAGATIGRATLAGDISNPFARPTGSLAIALTNVAAGKLQAGAATLEAKSDGPGRFALSGQMRGKIIEPASVNAAAALRIDGGAADLTLSRLDGAVGASRFALTAPLHAAWRDGGATMSGLALALGPGSLAGDGSYAPRAMALHLVARDLPVHALARLGGASAEGELGFELTLSGKPAAPQGRLVVDGEKLRLAAINRPDLPVLGLVIDAAWRDGRLTTEGRLAGAGDAAIGWQGSGPLVLDLAHRTVDLPPAGAVQFHLEGQGDVGIAADLLPLGEDRLSGRFGIELRVGGTVGAPEATGRLTLTDGHYENLATGAVLDGVRATLAGDRDRLVLKDFAATDGAAGRLIVTGDMALAGAAGPEFEFSAELQHFRALRRDEAAATASGTLKLSGAVTAPRLAATLAIEEAEIAVPEKLPQSVSPVDAIVIDSATGKTITQRATQTAPPVVLALDATVALSGKAFVRGRGLDSEWRGRVQIAGDSSAPILTGKLETVRGTYDFIGKTFVLSQGTITFLGGAKIDPAVDIEATAQSSDITAIVDISGYATRPTIGLSSSPALPRDEVLSRLLFGTSMSQISPAQGIQLAGAAASLAGGESIDVLAKIRRGLGLDRLTLGAAPGAAVPGLGTSGSGGSTGTTQSLAGLTPLTPGSSATASPAGTALNAGKYVASGVYVGVSQGIGAASSTVTVQVDVTRHISIDTQAGQESGTGVGVNWKLDY